MLNDHLLKEFYSNGLIIVKDVFTEEMIQKLLRALDLVRDKVNAQPYNHSTRYLVKGEKEWDTWGVNNILSPKLFDKIFDDFIVSEKLLSIVSSILGEELRLAGDNAFWDPQSNDYELVWHRDYGGYNSYFDKTGKTDHVQFNLALVKDESFRCVLGSHKRELTDEEIYEINNNGKAMLPNEITVECKPGDMVFMNSDILHRGFCKSGSGRRTLHFRIEAKNSMRGGRAVQPYMKDLDYIATLSPKLQELIHNATEWNDVYPLSLIELRKAIERFNKVETTYLK